MDSIERNRQRIMQKLGPTQLVVVSKYRSLNEIQQTYDAGQRVFAENRVQALMERYSLLPPDIQWHLIGHLQTNKVKYIAPFIAMIHSVDSLKLLQEIDRQAEKNNRIIPCLLQIYVATEDTKFGLDENELHLLLQNGDWKNLSHVRICGIMAMASLTEDKVQIHQEFENAHRIFLNSKSRYFQNDENFRELSIGMSSDYEIALEHGSTMVRIGSKIFESD
ncbi:MAG: YggS family pyridoxal phosphate-dependent enzyme [Bacteroidetes bacterium]|nr:YggS family pyridoxal phosphate-dependent enzyme [Bacteroidota bacterium]